MTPSADALRRQHDDIRRSRVLGGTTRNHWTGDALLLSSLWCQPPHDAKLVWVVLVGLSDKRGIVRATEQQIADAVPVSVKALRAVLRRLLAPDPYSNLSEDGRHLDVVKGGWQIRDLNAPLVRATRRLCAMLVVDAELHPPGPPR